jgi:hypothetical protein
MKTFYSILSINIRPEINESLSVGMLMIYGEKVFYRYSKSKLSIANNLIGKPSYRTALDYLRYIERAVNNKEVLHAQEDTFNIKTENKYTRLFSEQYIEYLSRYNNNLITFSSPKFIELECSHELFQKLFVELIDEHAFDTQPKVEKTIELFRREYFPKAKPYFNTELKINLDQIRGLFTPVEIDLLGKNERNVFAQTIDFSKKSLSTDYHITSLIQLNKAMPDAKQFVLGQEPDKNLPVNHHIWENIREIGNIDYLDLSEAEKVLEYAKDHEVKPLFEEEHNPNQNIN